MNRSWWPFCLEMFSRRIMILRHWKGSGLMACPPPGGSAPGARHPRRSCGPRNFPLDSGPPLRQVAPVAKRLLGDGGGYSRGRRSSGGAEAGYAEGCGRRGKGVPRHRGARAQQLWLCRRRDGAARASRPPKGSATAPTASRRRCAGPPADHRLHAGRYPEPVLRPHRA